MGFVVILLYPSFRNQLLRVKVLLNSPHGKKVVLRDEHDAGSLPLTHYPSMDKADWMKIFQNGKLGGLNH